MLANKILLHLALVRLLFSYDLLAKSNTITANIHSIRANGQVMHLPLFFTTERAAQPTLLLWFFRSCAYCSDTFVTDIDTSGPVNETLDWSCCLPQKEQTYVCHLLFLIMLVVSPVCKHLDGFRSHLLQVETKAFQHSCAYAFSLAQQS